MPPQITQLIHGVMSSNAQITLIILSTVVLAFTVYVSGLTKEWMRYIFLVLVGIALYFASNRMTTNVNREFISGLSTELFGAAITLVFINSLQAPSMWWMAIFAPVAIGGELLMYHISNPADQNYFIGIWSNIWGALLVAILIEELVYERKNKSQLHELRERFAFRQFEHDMLLIQKDKQTIASMTKELEIEIARLRKSMGLQKTRDWDPEIAKIVEGKSEALQKQMLNELHILRERFQQRQAMRNMLLVQYRKEEAERMVWELEREIEHFQKAKDAPRHRDWDLQITVFGHNPTDLHARVQHVSQRLYLNDKVEVTTHPNKYCHCSLKANTRKAPETSENGWRLLTEKAMQDDAGV